MHPQSLDILRRVFGYIKPDVQARKADSAFVAASGKKDALSAFFTRFLLNCDQWDGYNSERKALMSHLKTNGIGNVVAITGDIHSFFAGTVNDDFDAGGGGTPVMVDLVSAGISSDSWCPTRWRCRCRGWGRST